MSARDFDARWRPVLPTSTHRASRDAGLFFPVDPGSMPPSCGMARRALQALIRCATVRLRENVPRSKLATRRVRHSHGAPARKSAACYDLTRLFVGFRELWE